MDMTYEQYTEMKKKFFAKHQYNFTTHTGSMDQYSRWHKDYTFEDESAWCEDYSYVEEETTAYVHNTQVKVKVKMLRIEFYNSDNSESNYYYEQI